MSGGRIEGASIKVNSYESLTLSKETLKKKKKIDIQKKGSKKKGSLRSFSRKGHRLSKWDGGSNAQREWVVVSVHLKGGRNDPFLQR